MKLKTNIQRERYYTNNWYFFMQSQNKKKCTILSFYKKGDSIEFKYSGVDRI